jgi:hypothetical protein
MNLNQHSLAKFEADSSRNEPLLREWMKGEDWHWFRFPFLAEGDTPEKKRVIDTDLSLPPGANTLERVMTERQLLLPPYPVPVPPLDSLCR